MSRLQGTGALAACVVAGAWLVGSTALAVLGIGLVLAALGAHLWRRVVVGGVAVERLPLDTAPVEGEQLVLEVGGPRPSVAGRTARLARARGGRVPRGPRPERRAAPGSSSMTCRAAATCSTTEPCS